MIVCIYVYKIINLCIHIQCLRSNCIQKEYFYSVMSDWPVGKGANSGQVSRAVFLRQELPHDMGQAGTTIHR